MLSAGGNHEPTNSPGSGTDDAPPPDQALHDVGTAIAATGRGPMRLVALGITLFLFGFALRWGQDVAAPYINMGEADMAGTVVFEAEAGTYRVVSSGPNRPAIHTTVCEARGSDGESHRERGADGVDGGHERFGVTRVTKFVLPAGRAEVQCGYRDPDRGDGLGRFQVVADDGPVTLAVTGLLVGGGISLAAGLGWLALRFGRHRT